MALEAGGYAEKLGNRYEANWGATRTPIIIYSC